jgi:hypothetical protein
LLFRAGSLITWLLLGVLGFRLVLARDWHGSASRTESLILVPCLQVTANLLAVNPWWHPLLTTGRSTGVPRG